MGRYQAPASDGSPALRRANYPIMSAANIVVLLVYLVCVLGAALWVARRKRVAAAGPQRAGDDYFLAGRSLGGCALGLSMVATQMSSVTFLAYPATAYRTNWLLINKDFALPLVCAFAAMWVIPFYRRHMSLSLFELVEARFNLGCRLYCSACYCLLQLTRTCSVLYLVSFPVEQITGLPPEAVTVLLGVIIAVYTVLGGFAAVVFTDVVQAVTLAAGGALTIGYCVARVPGGLGGVLAAAGPEGKLRLDVDAAGAGRSPPLVWTFGCCLYVTGMVASQDVAQRYCAARSLRQARLAVLLQALHVPLPYWEMMPSGIG